MKKSRDIWLFSRNDVPLSFDKSLIGDLLGSIVVETLSGENIW